MAFDGAEIYVGNKVVVVRPNSENHNIDMNVAQYPVENGEPISNHSQMEQNSVDIDGKIVGKTWAEADDAARQLYIWAINKNLVNIRNGVNETNFIIQNWQKQLDEPSDNTVHVSFTLLHMRIPSSSYTVRKNSGKKQASGNSAGVYVTVRAGNTYWGWSMQYGTSIPTLRAWNKWPDRFIPIGVRARVK